MTEIAKQYILPLLLSVAAGISGYFQGTGAEKAKAENELTNKVSGIELSITRIDGDNRVQNTTIEGMKSDITEIKGDVKELNKNLNTLFGWNKPAKAESAPLISGVKKTGEPLNENDKTE